LKRLKKSLPRAKSRGMLKKRDKTGGY
jgi:hypothetical protein